MLENQLHWMVVTNFPNDGILLIVFITELPWQYSLNILTIFPICTQTQSSTCCAGISDTQQLIDMINTSNLSCIIMCAKLKYFNPCPCCCPIELLQCWNLNEIVSIKAVRLLKAFSIILPASEWIKQFQLGIENILVLKKVENIQKISSSTFNLFGRLIKSMSFT